MSYQNANKKYDIQVTRHKDRMWAVNGNQAMIWDTGSCGTIEMPSNSEIIHSRNSDPGYHLDFRREYGGENMSKSNRAVIEGKCGKSVNSPKGTPEICYSNAPNGFREDVPSGKHFNGILSAARPTEKCNSKDVCHYSPNKQYDCVVADMRGASKERKGTVAYYNDSNKDYEAMCNPPNGGDDDMITYKLEEPQKMGMSNNCEHPFVCFGKDNCALVDSGHPNNLANYITKNNFKGKVIPVSTFMDRKMVLNYKNRTLHMSHGSHFKNVLAFVVLFERHG